MSKPIDHIANISRFAIAAAIFYFGYQVAQVGQQVPRITESAETVSQQVEPALAEVARVRGEIAEVRALVPQILAESAEIRASVTPILDEIAAVRAQIPPMVDEIGQVRRQVPEILQRVDSLETRIDPILQRVDRSLATLEAAQQQLPRILETTDKAVASVDQTRDTLAPLVPQTLEEIRLTREAVDPTLDRVEVLVDDAYGKAQDAITAAQGAGKEASEGAVTGFFTGILKLPFKLVGTLASPIVNSIDPDVARLLEEKDLELMAEAGRRAVEAENLGKPERWDNPGSDMSGSITILRKHSVDERTCYEVQIKIQQRRRQLADNIDDFCRGDNGQWALASETQNDRDNQ